MEGAPFVDSLASANMALKHPCKPEPEAFADEIFSSLMAGNDLEDSLQHLASAAADDLISPPSSNNSLSLEPFDFKPLPTMHFQSRMPHDWQDNDTPRSVSHLDAMQPYSFAPPMFSVEDQMWDTSFQRMMSSSVSQDKLHTSPTTTSDLSDASFAMPVSPLWISSSFLAPGADPLTAALQEQKKPSPRMGRQRRSIRSVSDNTVQAKATRTAKGKKCIEPNCTRRAQSNSRCKAHGGGARCQYDGPGGCTRSSQGGGFCRAHGGGKRCEFPGCTRGQQRKGRCYIHGGIRKCQMGDCQKKDRGNGFCISHGGGKRCERSGCSRAVRRGSVCQLHE